ncbi:MAG: heparinase II/III domain-containing protein [Planctomycetota bacterium]|jgi:hypothetical protein
MRTSRASSTATRAAALLLALLLPAGCVPRGGKETAERFPRSRLETCRPRLFLRSGDWGKGLSVAGLRERCARKPYSDRLRLLRTTRANLALKWLITGDEKAAGAALASLRKFDRKVATSDDGLELIDASLAYDWLHTWKGFGARDKHAVEDRLLKLALSMRDHLTGEGPHVFVGVAGLALHDARPEGRELFEFARRYYQEKLLPARKIQGGAMHNGLSYGPNYMMFPLLQFFAAARSAGNVDYFHTADPADSEWLRETSLFLIHSVRPDGRHVLYADGSTATPAKHFRFMLDVFAAEYGDLYADALAERISKRFRTSGYHAEWIYMFLTLHSPKTPAGVPDELPAARAFSPKGLGHVFMRGGWSDDSAMVHFRCGDYFGDHGHFDQGAFTFFRRVPLAIESGGYWGFDSPHRHHYYKQAISTNTVIFSDPRDSKDEGRQRNVRYQSAATVADYLAHLRPGADPCLETGTLLAFDDSRGVQCSRAEFHWAAGDVTAAWDRAKVKSHVRHVALVAGRHLVVVDETETASPQIRARWLLHTRSEPRAVEGRAGAWAVREGKSSLLVQVLSPARAKVALIGGPGRECEVNGVNYTYTGTAKYLRSRKGKKDPDPAYGLWRMEVESAQAAARRLFVVVLTAGDADEAPPPSAAKVTPAGLEVTVDGARLLFRKVRG